MALPATANASPTTTAVPYMGWNTYYQVGSETPGSNNINESTIESVANSLVTTGLAKAGYNIVWLDFGWATGARSKRGNLIVDPTQWPHGMSGLTSYLHGLGLRAGIYTDAGNSGCSNQGVGSYGHYQQDANQFAAWGFDAVKMDFCGAGQQWLDQPPNDPRTLYAQFSSALAKNSSRRPMILNVCNFWTPGQINGTAPSFADSSWDTYSWAPPDAQSWRTDTDIGSARKPDGTGGIQFVNVLRNLRHDTGTASNASQPGIQSAAGPPSSSIAWGHWNDPDYLGPGLGMTDTQAQSQFSMWAMVAAPLILGSDPRLLSSTSVSMLENSRVIAIDQDSLGVQGYLLSGQGTTAQVWVKPLANGDRAVALLNTSSSSQQITTSASAVGMPSANQYTLLDVWTNTSTTTDGPITATVPAGTVVLYRVTPANTPAPIVTTGSSSSVSSSSATVSGAVNPNGQTATYHFDYGTSTSYGSVAPAPYPSVSGTTAQSVSTNLTGLSAGTTYHYRLEATNATGTTYGADQTFTTTGGTTVGPPSGPTTAPQGSWFGTYGGSGYDLAAWNGGNDVVSMPGVSVSLAQGSRYLWWSNTTDVRALESADGSTRNAATYYDANQIQVQLSFSSSYSGNLELYAVDLDKCGGGRQETITIGNQTANLSSDFSQGAWVVYPITVPVPATLTITVNHIAGCNAVLSGIFLN